MRGICVRGTDNLGSDVISDLCLLYGRPIFLGLDLCSEGGGLQGAESRAGVSGWR